MPSPMASNHDDPFLSTMTFALGVPRDCDCDECGPPLPRPIADAVREHKRIKLDVSSPGRIVSQERTLVVRAGGTSVWRWTLPKGAKEPMVEFGNSHRIVWVERMPKGATVRSIGKGIVGSSDEERNRKVVEWQEGRGYLIPFNGGKALGWIHEKSKKCDNKEGPLGEVVSSEGRHLGSGNSSDNGGDCSDVVLYMTKVTPDALAENNSDIEGEDTVKWFPTVLAIFRRYLVPSGREKRVAAGSGSLSGIEDAAATGIPLEDEDCLTLQRILTLLLSEKGV